MAQQTAVEWLEDKLKENLKHIVMNGDYVLMESLFLQAKQKEKEQHQISFNKGSDRINYLHDLEYGGVEYWEEYPKEFEQYYNETYCEYSGLPSVKFYEEKGEGAANK